MWLYGKDSTATFRIRQDANNIPLISSLNSFVLPLTALGSYWLLPEHEDQRKLWGSIALGMVGVCITAIT